MLGFLQLSVRAGVVVLGALLLSSTVVTAQPSPTVTRLLDRARAAAERGHEGRAWALIGRAVREAPAGDESGVTALAAALPTEVAEPTSVWRQRAAETRDAIDAFLEAAPAHADLTRLARSRSWAAALAGDHVEAIERAAGSAGLQDRASADLLRDLAALSVVRRDLHAAQRALAAAHRAYPQDNEVLADLGAVELALGRPGAAVERFGRILGRQPADFDARSDLAGALVAAGRAAEAVELLAPAAAHYGDAHPELHLELAYAALEASNPRVAVTAARAAIAVLGDDDARGHTALGAALAASQQRDEAESTFEEALRRDPRDVRARQGLEALRGPERREPSRGVGRALAAP